MILRVLGCSGAELPDFRPPAFLIDDQLLLDAGTIGSVLTEEEQWKIHTIFITHSHLDHIRSIPALADNIIIKNLSHTVSVQSTAEVINAMQNHLFNNTIWPDFTKIPSEQNPVIRLATIIPNREYTLKGYSIRAVPVNHTVPTVGYVLKSEGKTVVYTGDTGTTEEIWRYCAGVDALIVEVSFPDSLKELAQLTKHLTPSMLVEELAKIETLPKKILITHPKPQYYDEIFAEINSLKIEGIELMHDGSKYFI
ncbi:MAG: 3',5'-cyclic-nucleotide phosphodiesterase [Desulfuromonadaceae bacterium]|nr:3',5'-cyclic-nucleotide phosphodiesterase [Desulfuromonadaceae bacterium]MDD2856384.1 3',5'-cyclic-nucleotide phosphodiesterase [Desulfuromonadaceae bacterium]